MNKINNPFIDKYSDIVEQEKQKSFAYHPLFEFYLGLHENWRLAISCSFVILCLTIAFVVSVLCVSSFELKELGALVFGVFCTFAFFGSIYVISIFDMMLSERKEHLYSAVAERFDQSDWDWIAVTLRDYWKDPEYTQYLVSSSEGCNDIKTFLQKKLSKGAKAALSNDQEAQSSLAQYLLDPACRNIAMIEAGRYVYGYTFSSDLFKALNAIKEHEQNEHDERLRKDENTRIEARLKALPAMEACS